MASLLAALMVGGGLAAALVWCAGRVSRSVDALVDEERQSRIVTLLALLAPGVAAAQNDPRAMLVWAPIASAARQLFPREFSALDRSVGGTFPFAPAQLEAAHARWTTDWLAWERTHDSEYKLKAATLEAEVAGDSSPVARGRLAAVEREKLERYQQRYEEYVRVAKALQALQTVSRSD